MRAFLRIVAKSGTSTSKREPHPWDLDMLGFPFATSPLDHRAKETKQSLQSCFGLLQVRFG